MEQSGMGFALSHMAKCGWKEGQGLGREENGMKEAIKVKMKFDSTGFGHDRAEEFTFQWWDHVFNKAAENITVAKNEKGEIELQRKEELIVSKSRPSVTAASMKAKLYGSFVKGATLHGAKEVSTADSSDDESDEDDEPRDMSMKLSDDQLFKICGGRTAHKGARHGLNMTSKLERVRLQEEELMRKWKAEEESSQLKNSSSNDVKDTEQLTPKTKKIKSKKAVTELNEDATNENKNIDESGQDVSIVKKKKKKKHQKEFEESFLSDKEYEETKKKRKYTGDDNPGEKKKIKYLIDQDAMTDSGIESVEQEIKDNGENLRKKKKKKNKEGNDGIQDYESNLHSKELNYENEEGQCKKKKKKSKKHNNENEKATSGIFVNSPETTLKKKKKKDKKDKEMDADDRNLSENVLDNEEVNTPSTVYKEKKKKKKKNEQLVCSTVEEVEVKIKKKKKSKKSREN